MRDVILVHGLWVPSLVMRPLALRLAHRGWRCHLFGYSGRTLTLGAHAERLARFARGIGAAHFAGHSFGGLVVLEALGAEPTLQAGAVVLLGAPALGCMAGRRQADHALGRWTLGAAEPLFREGRRAHWTRDEPLGVIAGSVPFGIGRLARKLPGVNDGVVRLEETTVDGMRARIVLPVSHSGMLLSARVAAQLDRFLRDGRFDA